MTKFEGKMWNTIGSVSWVESGYDMQPMVDMMSREDGKTLHLLADFIQTKCDQFIQHIREYEAAFHMTFNLTDVELAHVSTEVVSRGKLTYDTYMSYPRRLTGLHNNYYYTLPRLARVHN